MTARWTNDLYKSTEHRVFNNSGSKPRYSVPFFCNCDFDAEVAPADIAHGAAAAAAVKYAPIKAGHYIMQKLGLMWDQGPEVCPKAAAKAMLE
jgi:isopenicillin N synthase-like dioxygenase